MLGCFFFFQSTQVLWMVLLQDSRVSSRMAPTAISMEAILASFDKKTVVSHRALTNKRSEKAILNQTNQTIDGMMSEKRRQFSGIQRLRLTQFDCGPMVCCIHNLNVVIVLQPIVDCQPTNSCASSCPACIVADIWQVTSHVNHRKNYS